MHYYFKTVALTLLLSLTPFSPVRAMGVLESLLLSQLIQWGTLTLQQDLDTNTTARINQDLQRRLPLPIGNEFTLSQSMALGSGILEWQVDSKNIDAKTFQDPKVSTALDNSMVPFLKLNICNPQSFWHQQWLPRRGTIIVRVNSSDGKLVRTYSAQKKDCPQ